MKELRYGETFKCKSLRLMQYLVDQGFTDFLRVQDIQNPNRDMWIFVNSEELEAAIDLYCVTSFEKKPATVVHEKGLLRWLDEKNIKPMRMVVDRKIPTKKVPLYEKTDEFIAESAAYYEWKEANRKPTRIERAAAMDEYYKELWKESGVK